MICDFVAAENSDGDHEALDEENGVELSPECDETEKWEFEIECIADRILWDRDWELDDLMVDNSPEQANFLKAHLGIDGDYFTSIAPDPRNLKQVRRILDRLLRKKPR